MLINLSNHPYVQWDDSQKNMAHLFGNCIDLPFPVVDPAGDEEYVSQLVEEYHYRIRQWVEHSEQKVVVHLMGEMTFVFALLQRLKQDNIRCIASTTARQSLDLSNGRKDVQFSFVRFRDYFPYKYE